VNKVTDAASDGEKNVPGWGTKKEAAFAAPSLDEFLKA
jgi:hypothetical protein